MKAKYKITEMSEGGWFQLEEARWYGWKYLGSGRREEVLNRLSVVIKPAEFFDENGKPITP